MTRRVESAIVIIVVFEPIGDKMAKGETGARLFTGKRSVDNLTPREKQIWELYQAGKGPTEIGVELGMKNTSVSRNLTTIREKVAVNG